MTVTTTACLPTGKSLKRRFSEVDRTSAPSHRSCRERMKLPSWLRSGRDPICWTSMLFGLHPFRDAPDHPDKYYNLEDDVLEPCCKSWWTRSHLWQWIYSFLLFLLSLYALAYYCTFVLDADNETFSQGIANLLLNVAGPIEAVIYIASTTCNTRSLHRLFHIYSQIRVENRSQFRRLIWFRRFMYFLLLGTWLSAVSHAIKTIVHGTYASLRGTVCDPTWPNSTSTTTTTQQPFSWVFGNDIPPTITLDCSTTGPIWSDVLALTFSAFEQPLIKIPCIRFSSCAFLLTHVFRESRTRLARRKRPFTKQTLIDYAEEQLKLTTVLAQLEQVYNKIIGTFVVCNVARMTVTIYMAYGETQRMHMADADIEVGIKVLIWFTRIIQVATILFTCISTLWPGVMVNEASRSTTVVLLSELTTDPETKIVKDQLLQRLQSSEWVLTAAKAAEISRQLILTVITLTTTIVIAWIQFG